MSLIIIKVKQMWATMKSKFQNEPNQILMVRPIRSADKRDSDDDKEKVETEHLRIYRTIWRLIDLLASVSGVSLFKDAGFNCRIIFSISMVCVAFICLFFTMAVVWPSVPTLLEVICIFGVLLPGTFKLRLAMTKINVILSINHFFENMLINNPNGKRADHLAQEMRDAFKNMKIFIAISVICFGVFTLYPVYAYVNESRLIPLMRMEFPFLDQTNMNEYIIGLSIMLLFAVLGMCGNVSFDMMILVLLLQYGSLVTQLVLDFEDYHKIWKNKEEFSPQYRHYFLKNIFRKYQDINSYLRYFDEVFSANTCHTICVLYGSLICSVYAVFNNGWISGYGFVIFTLVQVYIPCILGTYVNDQNERMNRAIYFIPWYEYPVKVQKSILMLLHASSFNAVELWIGVFAPLNVATALQITKSIYSYYTAMSNLG